MNSQVEKFAIESLSHTGLVILNHKVARSLRPDIFLTDIAAFGDFAAAQRNLHQFLGALQPKVMLTEIRLADSKDWLLVAYRSDRNLAERLLWILGQPVAGLREHHREQAAPAKRPAPVEDGPPRQACVARREWFAQRGLVDPEAPKRRFAR